MADKSIGSLSKATSLNDDSLLVVEQQGEARSITGALVKQYAREGTEDILDRLAALEAKVGITNEPPQIKGPEIMDTYEEYEEV